MPATDKAADTGKTHARCAALYVRMSTRSQDYSIQHQCDKLYEYAAAHDIEVVTMYVDAGKSGLRINGRSGLTQLINDVSAGGVDFEMVLVYDVSRWGRFQDVDESAHYEFICRKAGIKVIYCQEQFGDDGSAVGTVLKCIKRAMAAEYSRELSEKVFIAQSKFAALGFKQGGPAGYGLRRAVIDQSGRILRVLGPGDRKGPTSDRVVFVPGPPAEIKIIQYVYKLYIEDKLGESRIATILNASGIEGELDRQWTFNTVRSLLTNEKYIGTVVYNRASFKLHNKVIRNPVAEWIKKPDAFAAIVSAHMFKKAAVERMYRMRHISRAELLDILRAIYRIHGKVTTGLIAKQPGAPHHSAFRNAFGNLLNAYILAGVPPTAKAQTYLASLRKIETIRNSTVAAVRDAIIKAGSACTTGKQKNTLRLSDGLLIKIAVARCRQFSAVSRLRWKIPMLQSPAADFVIGVQLDKSNDAAASYLLLPTAQFQMTEIILKEEIPLALAEHRYNSISAMFGLDEQSALAAVCSDSTNHLDHEGLRPEC